MSESVQATIARLTAERDALRDENAELRAAAERVRIERNAFLETLPDKPYARSERLDAAERDLNNLLDVQKG